MKQRSCGHGRLRMHGWVLLLMALVAGQGCGETGPGAGDGGERQGGVAVLGSISDVDSWNEYLSAQTFASNLHRRIFLRLAQELGDNQEHPPSYAPLLAESWSFSEDRLALTFKLREAQWSDGEPITSRDVRFTWMAQTSRDVPWRNAMTKARIQDVQAVDDRTVVFRFRQPYPDQLADAVDGGILPEHVFGKIPFNQWTTHDWSGVSIGSGPFLLDSYRPGDQIVLRRNPRYFREGYPRLDRVVVRIVPDIANLLTQLRSGDIDFVDGIAPRDAHQLSQTSALTIVPFDYDYGFIAWNGMRPPFEDSEVRRAMTMAIDREAIVEDLLFGYGNIGKGPVLSTWWGSDRSLEPWPYDPERARRILAKRGYATVGADGKPAAKGKTLSFTLMTNAGNGLREAVMVKVQEQLSRVGVQVEVRPLQMNRFQEQVMAGSYDACLGGWVFVGKVDLRLLFGSNAVPPRGLNIVAYREEELDRMLDRVDAAAEWQQMKPPLIEIQQRIHEDQPYTFLYELKRLVAYGPRMSDVRIDVSTDPLARLEEFRVVRQ